MIRLLLLIPFLLLTQDSKKRGIPPERFEALHAMIKPRQGEAKWAQLPWHISLWEAREKAAKEGKPLFIWGLLDGHALGKT